MIVRIPVQCEGCTKDEAQIDLCRIRTYQFKVFNSPCPREAAFQPEPVSSKPEEITPYPSDWYDVLVSDCTTLIERVKHETGVRFLRGKWQLGDRVLQDYNVLTFEKITFSSLAADIGVRQQRVSEWKRFREKLGPDFEEGVLREWGVDVRKDFTDLSVKERAKLPSWLSIVREWLPTHRRIEPPPPIPLPPGKFNVLLADPPWKYKFSMSERGKPEKHYATMTLQEICDLPVPSVCADDAILFLWATNPKLLEEPSEVIRAWDFEYTGSNLCWVKDRIGTGFYFRGMHEILLVCKRGSMGPPAEKNRPPSVLHAKRRGHSQKPLEVYDIIERMYPGQRYLELFARDKRAGWTSWGDEIPQCILKRNLRLKTKAKK